MPQRGGGVTWYLFPVFHPSVSFADSSPRRGAFGTKNSNLQQFKQLFLILQDRIDHFDVLFGDFGVVETLQAAAG